MSKLFYFIVPILILASGITAATWSSFSESKNDFRRMGGNLRTIEIQIPSFLEFAGEEFPLENWTVRQKLEKELRKQLTYPEHIQLLKQRSARYERPFKEILGQYGVPEDFFYLAIAESHLSNVVSPAGATGFWQLMPATARNYGLEVSETVDERYHPEKSTHAAARYLRDSYKELQDWTLVAAAYNMGSNGLARAMVRQGAESYYELKLNKETSHYVFKVLGYKCLLESPERFGMSFASQKEELKPVMWRTVKIQESIPSLNAFAASHQLTYSQLVAYNPWLKGQILNVAPGKTYEIRFPLSSGLKVDELVVKGSKLPDTLPSAVEPEEPYLISNA